MKFSFNERDLAAEIIPPFREKKVCALVAPLNGDTGLLTGWFGGITREIMRAHLEDEVCGGG